MMLLVISALSLLLTIDVGMGQTRPDMYGLINILYLKADQNIDQNITRAELDAVFHGFDNDTNGIVTESEFVATWVALTQQPRELAIAFFHLADLTDDGIIDNRDLLPLYTVFDLNQDGMVSAQEFAKKWEDIILESPLAVLFERSDLNKDEFLSQSEFNKFFNSFDKNNDHMVSKHEFEQGWKDNDFGIVQAADAFFDKLDKDQDGQISTHDQAQHFVQYDANHDQKLSILEVTKMKTMIPLPSS